MSRSQPIGFQTIWNKTQIADFNQVFGAWLLSMAEVQLVNFGSLRL